MAGSLKVDVGGGTYVDITSLVDGGVSTDAGNLLTLGSDGKIYLSEAAFTNFVMSRLNAKTFIAHGANPPTGYTPGSAWIERE